MGVWKKEFLRKAMQELPVMALPTLVLYSGASVLLEKLSEESPGRELIERYLEEVGEKIISITPFIECTNKGVSENVISEKETPAKTICSSPVWINEEIHTTSLFSHSTPSFIHITLLILLLFLLLFSSLFIRIFLSL